MPSGPDADTVTAISEVESYLRLHHGTPVSYDLIQRKLATSFVAGQLPFLILKNGTLWLPKNSIYQMKNWIESELSHFTGTSR
jgi:hypothetical protein